MLEAENQHLRSLSQRSETSEQSPSGQPSAGAESAAASELNAEAAVAGPPVSSVPRPPSPQHELPRPCKWLCTACDAKALHLGDCWYQCSARSVVISCMCGPH